MHLFIVNEQTLPVGLKYGFAGTTGKQVVDWGDAHKLHGHRERAQASLYADICGVRKGGEVILYLEKPANDTRREGGRFFGIFQCASDAPFLEPEGAYLAEDLGVRVHYRVLLEPLRVYGKGLTEWYMMDEMAQFRDIHDVPWTLIYRKLAGGRGCTPLLPHEAEMIRRMVDLKNAGQALPTGGIAYCPESIRLRDGSETTTYDAGTAEGQDIRDRLTALIGEGKRACEVHLQAYLMQEIRRNKALTRRLFPGLSVDWIGNEIYCGAGMQRIDILAYASNTLNRFVHLLELKSGEASREAASQINRYVMWLKAHVPGIVAQQIIPTVVCQGSASEFHDELRIYLQGHGIESYREVNYDSSLRFDLRVQDV